MTHAIAPVYATAPAPSASPSMGDTFYPPFATDVLEAAPPIQALYPSPFQTMAGGTSQPTVFFAKPLTSFWDYKQAADHSFPRREAMSTDLRLAWLQYASHDFEHQANTKPHVHPSDRAILFAKARLAQEKQLSDNGHHDKKVIKQKIGELCLQEALACQQAAALTTESVEKFAWLQSALLALNPLLMRDPNQYSKLGYTQSVVQQQCNLISLLFHEMGELLLKENLLLTMEQFSPVLFRVTDSAGDSDLDLLFPNHGVSLPMQFAAAHCFKEAGKFAKQHAWIVYSSVHTEARKVRPSLPWECSYNDASAHFKRALSLLRKIDLSNFLYHTSQRLLVQDTIGTVAHLRWHTEAMTHHCSAPLDAPAHYPSTNEFVSEWQKTAELYSQCALEQTADCERDYYLFKQSRYLARAAGHSQNLKQKSELYAKAYAIAVSLRLSNSELVYGETCTLEELHGHVVRSKKLYEASLKPQADAPLPARSTQATLPVRLWNAVLSLIGYGP